MAVISPKRVDNDDGTTTVTWAAITTADTGGVAIVGDLADKTVHVVGGGSAQLQGSNNGSSLVSIGSAMAANSLTGMTINPLYVGIGTVLTDTVTVILVGRRRK